MQLLRNECKLDLCFTPSYMLENADLKICYLNKRSLHKDIDDVRKGTNYLSANILIFTETRFSPHHPDEMYTIDRYELFRNDETSNGKSPLSWNSCLFQAWNVEWIPLRTLWHRANYRKNNRTSRLNYNWNIQITKGCIFLSFNCHS